MEIELDENISIKQAPDHRQDIYCSWTGDVIDGLYLEVNSGGMDSQFPIVAKGPIALSNIEEVAEALDSFEPSENFSGQIDNSVNVVYTEQGLGTESSTMCCPICMEGCSKQGGYIAITAARLHYSCVDEFLEIIDQIWEEHSDEVLAESLR